jgi:carboxypeptidase C (cathepsin A)
LNGIGPIILNNDMTFSENPNSFTSDVNLMFIDLLGSGFAFASNISALPTDAKQFGVQLTSAINTFIEESILGQSSKLIIAG